MIRAVVGLIRGVFKEWKMPYDAAPMELQVAIMSVRRVQTWFLHHRGDPLVRGECTPCGKSRPFTIWTDGRYRCLPCLYRQALEKRPGPIPMCPSAATMRDFAATWLEYRRRVEALEDPWVPSLEDITIAHLTRMRPPPICAVGSCGKCGSHRPFMRREDGDAGCIHCLMHGRIVEFEIEVADLYAAA